LQFERVGAFNTFHLAFDLLQFAHQLLHIVLPDDGKVFHAADVSSQFNHEVFSRNPASWATATRSKIMLNVTTFFRGADELQVRS
jgi:hypothetical protein